MKRHTFSELWHDDRRYSLETSEMFVDVVFLNIEPKPTDVDKKVYHLALAQPVLEWLLKELPNTHRVLFGTS